MTLPISLIVTALVTAAVILLWLSTTHARRIDPRSWRLWAAAIAALCIGLVVGEFYTLLDTPLIWP